MKAIMIMFDSLNRDYLCNYSCEWTKLPNFRRLQEKTLKFENFYSGSLPCMPARREIHTGRYNFLHRSWGPMEPFDESTITNLKEAGVYTHLVSDHFHYWEDGGIGFHTKYNTWECIRGQQGDLWIPEVSEPTIPESLSTRGNSGRGWQYASWRQDWINRKHIDTEEKMPQARTFEQGINFIACNKDEDNWFLQIETFDPHEPFYTQQVYKDLYPHEYQGKHIDWPDYGPNTLDTEATEHVKYEYAALLSMCDAYLGKVLDKMDEYGMWEDTMLIVNTDHGFMLGEKEWMGKNFQPMYNEIVHLPFFIYDPRYKTQGELRQALAQTIDIGPTLLEYFGAKPLAYADGVSLTPVIKEDMPVREAALYGIFGGSINVTDGYYTYMHMPVQPENKPLFEYTLMPTHMNSYFSVNELQHSELSNEFRFLQGCKVLKIPSGTHTNPYWNEERLYDLTQDPKQLRPIQDLAIQREMVIKMRELMLKNEAPDEAYERFGIPKEGEITLELINTYNTKNYKVDITTSKDLTKDATKTLAILLSMPTVGQNEKLRESMLKALETRPEQVITGEIIEEVLASILPDTQRQFVLKMIRAYRMG